MVRQLHFPCQIYHFIRKCGTSCCKSDPSLASKKDQIIAQFRQELDAFESCHPANNILYFDYSEETKAELADIQQRLEKPLTC